jgi:hypothetical protein
MNAKEIITWTLINVAATVLATVILYYFFRFNEPKTAKTP